MRQNRDKKAKWRTHIFEQGNHGNRKGELRKGGRVTNYAKQQENRRIHELLESKEIKKSDKSKKKQKEQQGISFPPADSTHFNQQGNVDSEKHKRGHEQGSSRTLYTTSLQTGHHNNQKRHEKEA